MILIGRSPLRGPPSAMTQLITRGLGTISCTLVLSGRIGCTVNPKPDFDRAGEKVRRATGQDDHYRPDDDDKIADRAQSLLAEGLTLDRAVTVALLNNRDLQAAWMQIGMARADFVQ